MKRKPQKPDANSANSRELAKLASRPTPVRHALPAFMIGREEPLQVHVVGAGGNGSQVLTCLARMHLSLRAVGHPGLTVTVFDPDIVTEANVGRQLFSPADVGQAKACVLVHRINLFYGFNWASQPVIYNGNHTSAEILIGCVDSIAARRAIERTSPAPIYWLDLGNKDRTGQVILGAPKRGSNKHDLTRPPTFFEIFPELLRKGRVVEDTAPSCSLAAALERQDLFINQACVTWAMHLLWTFLREGALTIHGYFINLETGRVVPIPIPHRDPPPPLKPKATSRNGRKPKGKTLVKILS